MKYYNITVPEYMLQKMQIMRRVNITNIDSLRNWYKETQTRTLAPDMIEECCKDREYMMMVYAEQASLVFAFLTACPKDAEKERQWYKDLYGGNNGRDKHVKHQAD